MKDKRLGIKKCLKVQAEARAYIPGGCQLLSKRPEMFAPGQWPGYFSKAKGVDVWDLDGNKYTDMSISGIGANVLGYADPDVDAAVIQAIKDGNSSSLNCGEEVELAKLLCSLHPWAGMARFSRTGGEAMAIAVRIARASSGKDKIAFCGYHGWHDWYLAANLTVSDALGGHLLSGLNPNGVPKGLAGTAMPFRYNNLEDLKEIIRKQGRELGVIVMEPVRDKAPAPGFLEGVRTLANKCNAVLVFDEITAAWRMNGGGSHLLYGVNPDIAVFAKAISNGYPMAAVIGSARVMQAAQETFISSTYWTERIGPVAALATIRKYKACRVSAHLMKIGGMVQKGWVDAASKAGIGIHVGGILPLSHFSFDGDEDRSQMTLFVQLMLERGFLAGNRFYATYAHQTKHVKAYLFNVQEVFKIINTAVGKGTIRTLLKGPAAHQGFRRLT